MASELIRLDQAVATGPLTLLGVLGCAGFSVPPLKCKLHLAAHNGTRNPLDVFLSGEFKQWQELQSRRNFERGHVLSLIQLPASDLWLFAGCFRVLGCADGGEGVPFRYQTEAIALSDDLTGRLVIRFARPGRQSYLCLERWADDLRVHELKAERVVVGGFPGFKRVRLSQAELNLVVTHGVDTWRSALSSVGGIYLITDLATGKLYVGSACGEGGIWARWTAYQQTGHGGNKELRELLAIQGREYAANFQFAVLETADTHADQEAILARESHWKQVLVSRVHGLNAN